MSAAPSATGHYAVPLTVRINVGNSNYEPFGTYDAGVQPSTISGNVNDNSRSYSYPTDGNAISSGTGLSVSTKGWLQFPNPLPAMQHYNNFKTVETSGSNSNRAWLKR